MAKIQSQSVVITFNKLVKDSEAETGVLANDEVVAALEQVAQELTGEGVIVEVQVA